VEGVYYCTDLQKGAIKLTTNYRGISLSRTSYKMLSNMLLSRLSPHMKLLGIIGVCFDVTDQLLITYLHSSNTGEERKYNETTHKLIINFKKAYNSAVREVLYNNLIEFGITMKSVRPIKICWNETYSKVRIGKHLPQGDMPYHHCFSTLL
jgi:hypothetical protein